MESGHTTFYSYKFSTATSDGKIKLDAIPLVVEFAMPVFSHFSLRAGAGSYFITSHLKYRGEVNSQLRSLGWVAGAGYSKSISDDLDLVAEIKWMNATEHELADISLGILLAWKFYEW